MKDCFVDLEDDLKTAYNRMKYWYESRIQMLEKKIEDSDDISDIYGQFIEDKDEMDMSELMATFNFFDGKAREVQAYIQKREKGRI